MPNHDAPSKIRYSMLGLTMMVAIMLYLDRVCLSIAGKSVNTALDLNESEAAWLQSAFFWSYALFQIPAGWVGDRNGARFTLAFYLAAWSVCTGLISFVEGFFGLFVLRLGCGLFEAGAYPVASGIVAKWTPPTERSWGSAIVAVGGRVGGAIAPVLTLGLMSLATSNPWNLSQTESWRLPFAIYGLFGIFLAGVFWYWFRDSPAQHHVVNDAERDLIRGDLAHGDADVASHSNTAKRFEAPPLLSMIQSRSLWLNSFVQFSSNFCWVFLITLFPKFLEERFATESSQQAWMQATTLYGGIVGMLAGGWITDRMVRRLGLRWGIAWSLLGSRGIVATAFFVGAILTRDWYLTIAMAMVAMATDLGISPQWAFAQHVSRKHVGSIMGWANMFGNIGAAVSPLAFTYIKQRFDDPVVGWQAVFIFCGVLQIVAAFASLGIQANRRID